ncbi:PLP-dependent transferase [Dacryopinax primogenitus]|uniref:PLP-dependent transferase n=1 Tax=Dacryopinax primogenitus (strain DJM 731) TaxID=1858805 RepID=M5GFR5_DACPD|nr:PLP-dependent transferase [Dacryopinax primogenitus]EJU04358.1 PLP-dependent transferase [Dacryopinax primogenitus]
MDAHIRAHVDALPNLPPIADPAKLRTALESLPTSLPEHGWGDSRTLEYLTGSIAGGLAQGQAGPRYWGFVTGGVLPIAQAADNLVTLYDQNVQVHLPSQSISTVIESRTLELLLSLLSLNPTNFPGRTFTTGATASNILGLACGRQWAIAKAHPGYDVAEDGFGGFGCKVLVAKTHASLIKAASLVGIGRKNVIECGVKVDQDGGLPFDLQKMELLMQECKQRGDGIIVSPGFGEVNTGGFTPEIPKIRALCDKYGAWMHIDGAFGAFAKLVPDLQSYVEHLDLADSITVDAHKWLNVPYDSAAFFTRHVNVLPSVFGPSPSTGGPAYLAAGSAGATYPALDAVLSIPSPLNVNIENSRRFRALPVFAALLSLGREGYAELIQRNVGFARVLGKYISTHGSYELLNPGNQVALNIVLFRAKNLDSGELLRRINASGKIYASPTSWAGQGAVRIAVSNWMTKMEAIGDGKSDLDTAIEVLDAAVKDV